MYLLEGRKLNMCLLKGLAALCVGLFGGYSLLMMLAALQRGGNPGTWLYHALEAAIALFVASRLFRTK